MLQFTAQHRIKVWTEWYAMAAKGVGGAFVKAEMNIFAIDHLDALVGVGMTAVSTFIGGVRLSF